MSARNMRIGDKGEPGMNERDRFLLSLSKDDFMRMKIVEALKEALESTPFEKVTVTALCEKARISRAAFYRLFENINDIVYWDLIHIMEEAVRRYPPRGDWRQTAIKQIRGALESLQEERSFYQRIYKEIGYKEYASAYRGIQRYVRSQLLEAVQRHSPILDSSCKFDIDFFACGANNAVATWAFTGMQEPTGTVAENIVACVPPRLAALLDKHADA